jgi:tetratricopeptide (TPR) repeat protein
VGLIIRICSLIALALIGGTTAQATAPSPLMNYARARMADSQGGGAAAVAAYAAALTAAPGNPSIALRAYREAIASGDRRLALRAAQLLEAARIAPPDARVLLFSDALSRGDWASARSTLDRLENEGGLAFLVPVLRAWTDFAARSPDPLAALESRKRDGLALGYASEHRVLLLLALGQKADGLTAARAQFSSDARGLSLRLAAAAQLIALKDKASALSLLQGGGQVLKAAREMIEAGKPLSGAINSAPSGVAALLSRVSLDLMRDNSSPAAVTVARLASFAAPPNDGVRITLAQALSLSGNTADALEELDHVSPSGLFATAALEARVAALQRSARNEEALKFAQGLAQKSNSASDHVRLGDVLSQLKRPAEAANAYAAAISRLERDGAPVPWNIWLLYGGALDSSGDWGKAKPLLQKAVELGSQEPEALNHLGYALLERGEEMDVATRLIARASALRPDDPAITDSLGWAWFKRGDTAQAIRILENASAGDPTISEIAEHLGDAYWSAGRKVDARYSWRAALVQAAEPTEMARLRSKIADGLARASK